MKNRVVLHVIMDLPFGSGNRDAHGGLKTAFDPMGDEVRRVSSQCFKRSLFASADFLNISEDSENAFYSTRWIAERVGSMAQELDSSLSNDDLDQIMAAANLCISGSADKSSSIKLGSNVLCLCNGEIKEYTKRLVEAYKDKEFSFPKFEIENGNFKNGYSKEKLKNIIKPLREKIGTIPLMNPVMSLKSRMDTSEIFTSIDGVAFSDLCGLTSINNVRDYFSAVDDLHADNGEGAAHLGEKEQSSDLVYGIVVVDIKSLIKQFDASSTDLILSYVEKTFSQIFQGFEIPGKTSVSCVGCVAEFGDAPANGVFSYLYSKISEENIKMPKITSSLRYLICDRNEKLGRDNLVVSVPEEKTASEFISEFRLFLEK